MFQMDSIKYENIGQYVHDPAATNTNPAGQFYNPYADYYGWPPPVVASAAGQQPNIHVNYIMNSNVIHNYNSATPSSTVANTGLPQQQQTQSVRTFAYYNTGPLLG